MPDPFTCILSIYQILRDTALKLRFQQFQVNANHRGNHLTLQILNKYLNQEVRFVDHSFLKQYLHQSNYTQGCSNSVIVILQKALGRFSYILHGSCNNNHCQNQIYKRHCSFEGSGISLSIMSIRNVQYLRNGPDKNDSNNGNEHVGMDKTC